MCVVNYNLLKIATASYKVPKKKFVIKLPDNACAKKATEDQDVINVYQVSITILIAFHAIVQL